MTLRVRSLARYLPPGQPLLDLHGPENDGAQRDGDGEISKWQRLCLQQLLKERGVDSHELQRERDGDRPQERLVREQAYAEERLIAGADSHDVGQLREGEGGEEHGLPDLGLDLRVPQARRQRHERHQGPDPENVAAQAPGEDALAGGRGGRRMVPRSAGSALTARAGRPSVTRLIQSIWRGTSGNPSPTKGPMSMTRISPEL